MGLYYQAILSLLLLNFLPDLPTTFFFIPTIPHPVFTFTLALTFFFLISFLCFFHITAVFPRQVKTKKQHKKKNLTPFFFFVRATYVLFDFFLFTQKVPIFCEDCRQELTEAFHNSKDGELDTEPYKIRKKTIQKRKKKVATLYIYCGSSDSCFQLTMVHGMPTSHRPLHRNTRLIAPRHLSNNH